MDFQVAQFYNALVSVPPAVAIAMGALALASVAGLVLLPLALLIRTEPREIIRSFKQDRLTAPDGRQWRSVLHRIAAWLTAVNTVIGRLAAWLALYMALMQFAVVVMRYIFSFGSIQMQESIWYMHGLLFMLGAGYALAKDRHVRLDVLYRNAGKHARAWINLAGAALLLLPLCIANFVFAWPLVRSSWAVREGSLETLGLPYIYLFKTVILVFSIIVAIEGVSVAIRSVLDLTENRGKGETAQ